ncbi:MAG: PH domain-containing protein [Acidobacteria bacterium]|nr:PH domain-containing protein [Acidobacteriota bacterium]
MLSGKEQQLKNLIQPGEEILERANLHWMVYRWPVIIFVYGCCLTVLFYTAFINEAIALLPFFLIFLSMLGGAMVGLRRMATEYVVTNRRLILIDGFIGSTTREIELTDIRKVHLKQDSLGRRFDFGKLELTLENGQTRTIRPLGSASKFVRWVEQLTNDAFLSRIAREERAEADWVAPAESSHS